MKKIIILLLLITFTTNQLKAQKNCDCFNRLDNLGMYYERIGNNLMALSAYKDALSYRDSDIISERHYVTVARMHYNLEQFDSSLLFFSKALQRGYDTAQIKIYYSQVTQLKEWNTIKLLQKIPPNFNWNVYNNCIVQVALDQSIRGKLLYPSFWATGELKKYESKLTLILGTRIDSTSNDLLTSLLNKYGFPTYEKLGFTNSFYFNLLASHTSDYKKNIIDKLKDLNKSCEYPYKSDILYYMDRNTSIRGYTLAGLYGLDRFIRLPNINIVDSIRFEYNQLRIKEDAYKNGDIVPDNYSPLKYPANYFCSDKYKFD